MPINEKLKQRIVEELKISRCYEKIARKCWTSVNTVERVDIQVNGVFNKTPEGRGRKELQKYIVASINLENGEVWDNESPEIIKARQDYDNGLIELTQGRDGFNILLYAIPRKKVIKRKSWFQDLDFTNVTPLRRV